MNIKHIIICSILCILVAAAAFCMGMNHAIRAMEISTDGENAIVLLHENLYIHSVEN